MTITPDILLAAGYRKYHDVFSADKLQDWYQASYQKRFDDVHGKRYFITFCHSLMPRSVAGGRTIPARFSAENQFKRGTMVVNIQIEGESLAEVEAFFAQIWSRMAFDYYEGGPAEETALAKV